MQQEETLRVKRVRRVKQVMERVERARRVLLDKHPSRAARVNRALPDLLFSPGERVPHAPLDKQVTAMVVLARRVQLENIQVLQELRVHLVQ